VTRLPTIFTKQLPVSAYGSQNCKIFICFVNLQKQLLTLYIEGLYNINVHNKLFYNVTYNFAILC